MPLQQNGVMEIPLGAAITVLGQIKSCGTPIRFKLYQRIPEIEEHDNFTKELEQRLNDVIGLKFKPSAVIIPDISEDLIIFDEKYNLVGFCFRHYDGRVVSDEYLQINFAEFKDVTNTLHDILNFQLGARDYWG